VKRETNALKIPYYVKDNFYSEYQGSVWVAAPLFFSADEKVGKIKSIKLKLQ